MPGIFGLCSGDPFGPRSYSGSARQLFLALQRRGALRDARDVDGGRPLRRRAWVSAIVRSRRVWGRRLLARWDEREMERRSRRAAALLAAAPQPAGALMYGTDFFPAAAGARPRVPVGAALDTTFAQLARSGEHKFASLTPAEVEGCVARQRAVFERCAWLFPRSQWCAESLVEDYGLPRDRLVVTGAGPNLDEPLPERPAAGGHDRRTILFVGRDWHRKNGPLVLDGFRLARAQRPDLRLIVVGPRQLSHRAPGVEWLGALDGGDRVRLPELYRRASLFLCPSRFEPFGIAILEALAAGCPAVALDRGAAREILRDGVTGSLLPRADPRALAEAILFWLDDAQRLTAAGLAARETVRRDYSWDLVAERIDAALRGGVPGRGTAPAGTPQAEVTPGISSSGSLNVMVSGSPSISSTAETPRSRTREST